MLNSFVASTNFADDTKNDSSVLIDEDRQTLQEDLLKISTWPDRWEMTLNEDKFQIIHFGTRNKRFDYKMCGVKLKNVECVKDLGVKIGSCLKFSHQSIDVGYKANKRLGFL